MAIQSRNTILLLNSSTLNSFSVFFCFFSNTRGFCTICHRQFAIVMDIYFLRLFCICFTKIPPSITLILPASLFTPHMRTSRLFVHCNFPSWNCLFPFCGVNYISFRPHIYHLKWLFHFCAIFLSLAIFAKIIIHLPLCVPYNLVCVSFYMKMPV